MLTYTVVGLILMAIGKPWQERREVKRILAGKTTMMADAQTAAYDDGLAVREKVLKKYGVDDDQAQFMASRMEDEDQRSGDPFVNYGRSLTGIESVDQRDEGRRFPTGQRNFLRLGDPEIPPPGKV